MVCPLHGETQKPAYVVCTHIIQQPDLPIAHLQTPTTLEVGEVLCHRCHAEARERDRLQLVCPDCVHALIDQREFR